MKSIELSSQISTENKVQAQKIRENPPVREGVPSPTEGTDRVELSAGSREVQKMQEILQQTPEVRSEKVQALKERIDRHEYQVESLKVADKMLQALIDDDVTNI